MTDVQPRPVPDASTAKYLEDLHASGYRLVPPRTLARVRKTLEPLADAPFATQDARICIQMLDELEQDGPPLLT